MKVTGYLVPNPDFIRKSEYKETDTDRQRKQADLVLEAIDGNYYSVRIQNANVIIPEKRVKRYSNGVVAVPQSIWNKLIKQYTYATNF